MLVVAVPILDLQYPPSSPAVIKSCVNVAGYSARTNDLNLLLLNACDNNKELFWSVQAQFESAYHSDAETNLVKKFFAQHHSVIQRWLDASIDTIKQHNPRWLGISVFSYKSHKASLLLAAEVRRLNLPIKIVLGGRGASSYALGPDHSKFKDGIEQTWGKYPYKNFGETLLHYNLVDKIIQGDGENAVVELLKADTPDNVLTQVDDIDLESVPFVDYDDYDLTAYEYVNEPTIAITGSKGCVRKCTFCDIPVLWSRFKYRTGDHIAKEMIHLYNKHNIKKFYLTDSLVNGSMRAFTDFITTLAEHNNANPEQQIKWVGQYITRSRSSALNDQYYDCLKASGGEGLTIGVESGSDAVRTHMKKQFTTADVDHELAEFNRRGIVCVLLFFSCYPTETWADFEDTIDMFIRYQQYCASGTVYKITLGTPYTHHAQTPLWNMQDSIGLSVEPGSDILWRLGTNPELTYYERVRRRLILQEVCMALKLPMSRNDAELNQLINSITNYKDEIESYFQETPNATLYPDRYNLTGCGTVLMPEHVQYKIYQHIKANPGLNEKIVELHASLNDDIVFENAIYFKLRSLIT